MYRNPWNSAAVCSMALLAVALLAQPVAAAANGDQEVRVRKIVKCEDGDCAEAIENAGDGIHKTVFVGDDGGVHVMAGDGGHAWASHTGIHGGGFLGVGLTELTPELRSHFGVPQDSGVMVSKVIDDSAAFKAGIEVGDIITSVDGAGVSDGSALASMIRGHGDGEEVALEVWRDGAARSIIAAVQERKGGLDAGYMKMLHERMGELHEDMGGMHKRMRKIMIDCDRDDEECESNVDVAGLDEFDCGGTEECEVKVECKDGDCTCTINGEDADCGSIPGVPGQ